MESPKVKVTISTMDGTVLDQFQVEDSPAVGLKASNDASLSAYVRDCLEHKFEVEDL